MNCVACGGSISYFGKQKDYEYWACESCSTIQLAPQPTLDDLKEAYTDYSKSGHYAKDPAEAGAYHANHYNQVEAVVVELGIRGKVLDYGAGWGELVQRLSSRGIDCQGVDLEPRMVEHAQKLGLPVRYADLDDFGDERFAAITMIAVFEHVVEHAEWLEKAKSCLEDDGYLIMIFPTARGARSLANLFRFGRPNASLPAFGRVFSPPWHTVLFSIDGCRELFERCGFDLIDVRYVRSSREAGVVGLIQFCLEKVNRVGWALMGTRWPLQIAHLFIVKKSGPTAAA